MKRFFLSEVALVCAPLALLVAGAFYFTSMQRLHPPRNPNAKIVLTVSPLPLSAGNASNTQPIVAWKAKATNSPLEGVCIWYSEKIVATGRGHSLDVYDTSVTKESNNSWIVSAGGGWSPGMGEAQRTIQGSWNDVPAWTDNLEWQGEFVAIPQDHGSANKIASPAKLRQLIQSPGAVYTTKHISIPIK